MDSLSPKSSPCCSPIRQGNWGDTHGIPPTVFIHYAMEALLNSHHTQHLAAHQLTSYELLLLAAPHIILSSCDNLKPVILLPSPLDETPCDSLTLTDHCLPPWKDLQETPLDNAQLS